ncbi:MAG: DUF4147 domain-containing protein [Thioalkalispiraceae bacterium]|jgi:hydroxypyruvate reductase
MNLKIIEQARGHLLTIFTKGLFAVNGQRCVEEYLNQHKLPDRMIWVVAIGKAASSMMAGFMDFLVSNQEQGRLAAGLLITKQGHAEHVERDKIEVIESDHPIPTEKSLQAGHRLVEFVSQVPKEDQLLFLISGGTSALVDVLYHNATIGQLEKLNRWLLSNPWPIEQINQIRQSVSAIKAGKLLNYIHTFHCIQLTISDVANNDLSVIGSGLLVKPSNQQANISLPDWVSAMQPPDQTQHTIDSNRHVEHHIIADNARAKQAIVRYASSINLDVIVNQTIEGNVHNASDDIVLALVNGNAGLYIWGGETVVDLPEQPGQGGRCQSLALLIAEKIKNRNDIVVLVAGTDGTDGPGDVAGAIVDGMTIERGLQAGLDSHLELVKANAGYYLEATGDLIDTGPTGTNVMDLILGIKLG